MKKNNRRQETESKNIMVATLGSWQIIPELLGFTNSSQLDLYKNHPLREKIRADYHNRNLNEVDKVWLVSTGLTDFIERNILSLDAWQKRTGLNIELKYFLLDGVGDLTDAETVDSMRNLIYHVVLKASEEKGGKGQLLLALSGGRKTMSADMLQAGNIFGCDAMLHVVDTPQAREKKELIDSFTFDKPFPEEFSAAYMPLIASDKIYRMDILDIKPKIQSNDFNIAADRRKNNIKTDMRLADEIRERQKKARSMLVNYTQALNAKDRRSNFRVLYSFAPRIINSLQNYIIGLDEKDRSKELHLLRQLPKAELHCHFGGILHISEMILTAKANIEKINYYKKSSKSFSAWCDSVENSVKNDDLSALKRMVPDVKKIRGELFGEIPEPYTAAAFLCAFEHNQTLLKDFIYGKNIGEEFSHIGIDRYQELGDLQGSALLQSEESIRQACGILREQCRLENVRYLELRHSPVKYTRGGLTSKRVVEIIREELKKSDTTEFKAIFIASRHGSEEEMREHVDLALDLLNEDSSYEDWIVGFDLAGAEHAKSPAELRHIFLPIMEKCINITIHAGEDEDVKNIWEAVYHLSADRIGHGLTLNNNLNLTKRFLDRKIGIEMCPSSNDQIVGYADKKYPLTEFLNMGLRVSVNTDNPGISLTDYSQEYLKAAQLSGGLSLWEILQLIRNSFQSAFIPFEKRQELIQEAENIIISWIDKEIDNI